MGLYEEPNVWWWDRYDQLANEMRRKDPEGWKLVDAQVKKL